MGVGLQILLSAALAVLWGGDGRGGGADAARLRLRLPTVRMMEVTGYCSCARCCGWELSWHGFGAPVFSSGRLRGRRKEVGVTASGGKARAGTVAADTSVLPFGTCVFVPGFGWGRVEDRGGAVSGARLDLWFDDHEKARRWGRRRLPVLAWPPAAR